MKAYKGFNKGLVCKGKQYAENTVFEEETAKICECGMHYCHNPFDVLDYYDLIDSNGDFNEFAEVEPLGEELTNNDKKYCTKKLKIGAKLSFSEFVNACFEFIYEKIMNTEKIIDDNDASQLASSGDYSQLASSGNYSQLASSGYASQLASSGYYSKLASSGDYSQLASSGYYSQLASSGHYSKLASSGDYSQVGF